MPYGIKDAWGQCASALASNVGMTCHVFTHYNYDFSLLILQTDSSSCQSSWWEKIRFFDSNSNN